MKVTFELNKYPGGYHVRVADDLSDEQIVWIDYAAHGDAEWESVEMPRSFLPAFRKLIKAVDKALEEEDDA